MKSKVSSRQKLIILHDEWDFITLLSQFLPCKIKHKKRWYCSEWIAYAFRIACVFDWRIIKIYDRKDLSPSVLYDLVTDIKHESKEI